MRRFAGVLGAVVLLFAGTAAGWPTDHGNNQRTGSDDSVANYSSLKVAFTKTLDGAVYASPILAKGVLIVATENDSVYGLDPATGAQKWYRHLRTPISDTSVLACSGNIKPTGITGTPAYDGQSGRVFLVTVTYDNSVGVKHELWGLNPTTGATVMNERIEVPGQDAKAEQQRAALATDSGHVYVAFGGLAGDCGKYRGAIIQAKTNGDPSTRSYVVPTGREAGMWAPGGMVVAPDHTLYMSAGNGESTSGAYDYSDSVSKLDPNLKLLAIFAPSNWAQENAADLDLGSLTPVWLSNGYVLQAGKAGQAYTIKSDHLGGVGGEVDKIMLCPGTNCGAYGVSAVTGATAYIPTTKGIKRVGVNSAGQMSVYWTAEGGIPGSPVAGPGALYAVGGSNLYAINRSTGKQLGHVAVGSTSRFATPALSGHLAYVPTMTGVTAVNFG